MASRQENSRNHSPIKINKLEGIDSFKKNLEKYFFSQVIIRDYGTEATSAKLVLELNCNFGLTEMLHHLNSGTWGNFESKELSFTRMIETLKASNDCALEIEELSIFLKDTSIVINKIYDESIPEQLEAILKSVSENFGHFTKGLTEIPYEIYVPVFEENLLENDSTLLNIKSGNNKVKDYFKYWGLYFYNEDDVLIYDIKNNTTIPGDLQMLNW